MSQDLQPTGECWCGCGSSVGPESFFAQGHDSTLEAVIVRVHYGGRAGLAKQHGYGPGGKNAQAEMAQWKARRKA